MNTLSLLLTPLLALAYTVYGDSKPLFSEDFTHRPPGDLPEPFMILDGQFSVKEAEGNRFMELPGSPLESFGVLFGPNETTGVQVTARIFATKSGRKFPTFAAGLNGVGGYKLRVSPAKGAIELVRGDDIKGSSPFKWNSGDWTQLKLSITPHGNGVRITAKAWQGSTEPEAWILTFDEADKLPAGKAGVWGMPFSGMPIQFDDLSVSKVP